MRVLIVDDSPQVAATLEIALSNSGWDAACAPEVKIALEILDTLPPIDAIVTDLDMPRADGYSLIAAVRSHARCAAAVIVVTSGSTAPNVEQRAITAGADAFFSKPYSPAAVRMELERLLTGRGQVEP